AGTRLRSRSARCGRPPGECRTRRVGSSPTPELRTDREAPVRFRADRDAFADAITWTARALPARPAVPVLAGMRLDIADAADTLHLSGFDYEVSARASVDVQVEEAGSVLVSGRLLAEIVRNLPPHPVELRVEGSRALLTCGSTRFTLLTLPLEDYPSLPPMPR